MSSLRLHDLGPLRVSDQAGERASGGVKPARLLAALLVAPNQRVAVDTLMDRVWAGAVGARVATLESHVWRVRRLLEPDRPRGAASTYLLNDTGGYRLVVNVDNVDSLRFAELAERAADLLAIADGHRACRACDTALRMWRSRPLDEVADEAWARPFVARLEEVRTHLRETRGEALLAMGRHRQVILESEAMLAEQPYREQLWAQRMLGLYREGRAEEALQAYQAARSLFLEAGLEPGRALRDLQHRILNHDPDLELFRGIRAVEPLPSRPVEVLLPLRLSPLIGRDVDTQRLSGLVGRHRLVTVTGPAGCGKSRLAIEVARAARDVAPDGIWLVDLAAIDAPDLVIDAVTSALRLAPAVVGTAVDALRAFLRDRSSLLLFDNCEHVLAVVRELATAVLADDSDSRILATSREPLDLDGEVIWPLGPLQTAPETDSRHSPEQMPTAGIEGGASPAARLFVSRAGASSPKTELDETSLGVVEAICRAVDGLPLAVELAAGRLRAETLGQLADELQRDPLTLRRFGHSEIEHHQTLQAALDRSYALLPESARILHRRLSILPGRFTKEAAEAVVGRDLPQATSVRASLDALLHASMLSVVTSRDGGNRHYLQLNTVRTHAAREADSAAETNDLIVRRGTWIEGLLAKRPVGTDPDVDGWHRQIDDDHDALRAVLQHHLDRRDETGLTMLAALTRYWYYRSRLAEGEHWMARALALETTEVAARAAVEFALAQSYILRDRADLAVPLVRHALSQSHHISRPRLVEGIYSVAWAALVRGSRRFLHLTALLNEIAERARQPHVSLLAEILTVRTEMLDEGPSVTAIRATDIYERALRAGNAVVAEGCCWLALNCALMEEDADAGWLWLQRAEAAHHEMGGAHDANLLECRAVFQSISGQYAEANRSFAASRAAARRAGITWPILEQTSDLMHRAHISRSA